MDERPSVLVVEDNQQNLELAQFLLEEAGLRVRAVRDALQARTEMRREPPELVLLDMHLPGGDWMALVAELRALPDGADVPIVAVTAHAMRGDRERFLAAGCDGYIAKPINVARFADEVRGFLLVKR